MLGILKRSPSKLGEKYGRAKDKLPGTSEKQDGKNILNLKGGGGPANITHGSIIWAYSARVDFNTISLCDMGQLFVPY